jgi:hypothetical protein
VLLDEGRHVAPDYNVISQKGTRTLHLRLIPLGHHCKNGPVESPRLMAGLLLPHRLVVRPQSLRENYIGARNWRRKESQKKKKELEGWNKEARM